MTTATRAIGAIMASLLAAAMAPSAFAASTYNLSTCTTANANAFGNNYACTSSGAPNATATAWSTTGAGSTFAAANIIYYSGGFGVRNTIEGLGVSAPDHAMDNSGQTDVILLSFAQSVALNSVTIGWSSTDSDISVLRYTGATPPTVAGQTIGGLVSNGWQLVGHYTDLVTNSPQAVNAGDLTSSWWLISAYNSGYGGAVYSGGNDYVKLLAVAATPTTNRTPEPGSLALAALALVGGAASTRRGARKA